MGDGFIETNPSSRVCCQCDLLIKLRIPRGRTLTATFRQPFDLLAITNTTWQRKRPLVPISAISVLSGSAGRTRTYNPSVNSRMLCH